MRRIAARNALTVSMIMLAAGLLAADKDPDLTPEKQMAILRQVSPGLVTVEYRLKYDKSQPPKGGETTYICPNCNRPHTRRVGEELVKEERPLEEAGFLLSPTVVVSRDTTIADRFIEGIHVLHGGERVEAAIDGYALAQNAVLLKLAKPLGGKAAPLTFQPSAKMPHYAVSYEQVDGLWTATIAVFGGAAALSAGSIEYVGVEPGRLVVDGKGKAVGLSFNDKLPVTDSWKQSPMKWERVSANAFAARIAALEKVVAENLLHVSIHFRSPQASPGDKYSLRRSFRGMGEQDMSVTEANVVGVRMDERRILVLANLDAKTTARLEEIRVRMAGGEACKATFVGTLTDYGALIATLEKPRPGGVTLADPDIVALKNRLLLEAELVIAGEQRDVHVGRERIQGYKQGRRGRIYPLSPREQNDVFLFDLDNRLITLPVAYREKVSLRKSRTRRSSYAMQVPIAEMAPILKDPAPHFDENNTPLSEAQENRIAWMGIALQGLSKELARANQCSEETQDGRIGGLVTYVYPGSPASKAGIEPGMILLRLHVDGEPKPVDVRVEQGMGGLPFQWEYLDRMPPQHFDRMPTPWEMVDNSFTRMLTDIGFGKTYKAEFFHSKKAFRKDFTVVESPPHYKSAGRFKSEALGLTVRDMTFEVRRYLQKEKDDPGVVISKVETGSKVAVAGIKPYEIITLVNGKAVKTVKEFEALVEAGGELDFSVSRMATARQVRVKLDADSGDKADDEKATPVDEELDVD